MLHDTFKFFWSTWLQKVYNAQHFPCYKELWNAQNDHWKEHPIVLITTICWEYYIFTYLGNNPTQVNVFSPYYPNSEGYIKNTTFWIFMEVLPCWNKFLFVLQNKVLDSSQLHMMHPLCELYMPLIRRKLHYICMNGMGLPTLHS
jgi:hypothetical protein